MKLQQLIDLVELAGKHELISVNQYIELGRELGEVKMLYEEFDERNNWDDRIYIITQSGVCDLINRSLYNYYGELYKTHHPDNVTKQFFINEIHNAKNTHNFGFEHFTDEMLGDGYDVIHDLWHENEAMGDNNPDGSFKK